MLTPKGFRKALSAAQDELQRVTQAIKTVKRPQIDGFKINLRELRSDRVKDLLGGVPFVPQTAGQNSDYIYVVDLVSPKQGLQKRLVTGMLEARDAARKKDYCQVNERHITSKTLYVGRSKNPKARLRQHLGSKNHGIYSMHLQRWATHIDAVVSISYMAFWNEEDLLIQAIEDGLWNSLRPLFGRKGAR